MATNLTPWGFFIGGEELHNNHHAFPSSAKFALRKFEFDIGWAAIRGFEKLGLAKVLRGCSSEGTGTPLRVQESPPPSVESDRLAKRVSPPMWLAAN